MPSRQQIVWAKFRVTMVAVVATAILLTLLYLLTGGSVLEKKVTLYLYISDATALTKESPVRVNGIDVGKVQAVALSGSNDPNRVIRVAIVVEREHLSDIPVDSSAQISSDTLVGDKFVDITRGRSTASIAPNGEIQFKPEPELLRTLDLAQFAQQLRDVDALLSDIEAGRNRVGKSLLGDKFYNDVRGVLVSFEKNLRTLTSPTGRAGALVYTDQLYRQIAEPARRLDESLVRLQAGEGAGRLLRDDAQYAALRDQLAGLQTSVAQWRSNPWLQSDQLYTGWRKSIMTLIQQVDAINANPLLSSQAYYESLSGSLKELQANVSDFRRDPQKYMQIKLF